MPDLHVTFYVHEQYGEHPGGLSRVGHVGRAYGGRWYRYGGYCFDQVEGGGLWVPQHWTGRPPEGALDVLAKHPGADRVVVGVRFG